MLRPGGPSGGPLSMGAAGGGEPGGSGAEPAGRRAAEGGEGGGGTPRPVAGSPGADAVLGGGGPKGAGRGPGGGKERVVEGLAWEPGEGCRAGLGEAEDWAKDELV